jgi:hypothetical protein
LPLKVRTPTEVRIPHLPPEFKPPVIRGFVQLLSKLADY